MKQNWPFPPLVAFENFPWGGGVKRLFKSSSSPPLATGLEGLVIIWKKNLSNFSLFLRHSWWIFFCTIVRISGPIFLFIISIELTLNFFFQLHQQFMVDSKHLLVVSAFTSIVLIEILIPKPIPQNYHPAVAKLSNVSQLMMPIIACYLHRDLMSTKLTINTVEPVNYQMTPNTV